VIALVEEPVVGVGLWLASGRANNRGLAEGRLQRAEDVLEQADAWGPGQLRWPA